MILWQGKSKFNKKDIVCIATGIDKPTSNKKTGNLIQTWFIGADAHPSEQKNNKIHSVCNLCPLIRKGCYVSTWPLIAIYNKYIKGGYEKITDFSIFKGRKLRWGSYGEGILCNYKLFKKINQICDGWTAYTHNHHLKKYQKYKQWMMASVENLSEAKKCWANNWRTFRIVRDISEKTDREVICPAQPFYLEKTGKIINCETCMLCCGNASKSPKSVVIVAHGGAGKLRSVTNYLEEMANESTT